MNLYFLVSLVATMFFVQFTILKGNRKENLWNCIDKRNRIGFRIFLWFCILVIAVFVVQIIKNAISFSELWNQIIDGISLGIVCSIAPNYKKTEQ